MTPTRHVCTSLLAAALLATALPTALAGPLDDQDADRVADLAEVLVCGSDALFVVVNNAGLGRVRCVSASDLDHDLAQRIEHPKMVFAEEDADADGFPSRIVVTWQTTTVDPKSGSVVTSETTGAQPFWPDSDDADPNEPVLSVVALGEYPSGIVVGQDKDGDGLPATLTIEREAWTFDRRTGAVAPQPIAPIVQAVDPDDNDPENPVTDFFDQDHDRIPDALEPTLCFLENDVLAEDGSCVGGDYTAPGLPGEGGGGGGGGGSLTDRLQGVTIRRPSL